MSQSDRDSTDGNCIVIVLNYIYLRGWKRKDRYTESHTKSSYPLLYASALQQLGLGKSQCLDPRNSVLFTNMNGKDLAIGSITGYMSGCTLGGSWIQEWSQDSNPDPHMLTMYSPVEPSLLGQEPIHMEHIWKVFIRRNINVSQVCILWNNSYVLRNMQL